MQQVILVDTNDIETGTAEKITAHEKGLLHRAFSVMISDNKGNILLQQRAIGKYHSEGLWTNACCSHPKPGDDTKEAALDRLRFEMGIETNIEKIFEFRYKIRFADGITEHEYDHVFSGIWNGIPKPDPSEVMAWRWMNYTDLKKDIKNNPADYTYWFRLIMERM
jgi:isopentenyl-diphosphate Delta-isomerase